MDKPILTTLAGQKHKTPPVWFMRQAGRHLPEYLELRNRAKDFLDFCYSPSLASEATLQPIERYDMDAAILFADILLIPDALDRKVRFEKGIGPLMEPLDRVSDLLDVPEPKMLDRLSPVFETVSRVKSKLSKDKTLIGFAGSPWTVATYVIEGRGGTDKAIAKSWAYEKPQELRALLEILSHHTIAYLKTQAKAGADVIMLFESWASDLSDPVFQEVVIKPNKMIIEGLRADGVAQPIIAFPRGCGAQILKFAEDVPCQGLGLDTAQPVLWAKENINPDKVLQGNLDPLLLRAGGKALLSRIQKIKEEMGHRPFIFNLGHGVLPDTPIAHVEAAIKAIRG